MNDSAAATGRALAAALATLYVPTLAPFVFGPLTECTHCVQTYATFVPIVPGALFYVMVPAPQGLGIVLAALASLGLLVGLVAGYRTPATLSVQLFRWVVVLTTLAQALVLGYLLRV